MINVEINNRVWHIKFVKPTSPKLRISNSLNVLGLTDNKESSIYINNNLSKQLLYKVLSHEMCHAFCFSYHIELDLDTEEYIADFIATYGKDLFEIVDSFFAKNISNPPGVIFAK